MKTNSALTIQGLNIGFNGVQILRDVDFSLRIGEVHGVAGKNGAGKSTLMKILSGVYHADSGYIGIFDEAIDRYSSKEALKTGIVMVYQDLSLVGTLTVTQNIFLSHHPYRRHGLLDDRRAGEEAVRLLNLLGVDRIAPDALAEELSVGQAQLVEIAKALARKPRILILDEPTASLTETEIAVLFRAIEGLKREGISIIYITHYLEDIMKICDRVTVLRDGRTITTAEVAHTSIGDMVAAMLGTEEHLSRQEWRSAPTAEEGRPPLLELRHVSTRHVHDVSMKVYPGEIIGLAGLLGSGRTEILRLFYGLDRVESGRLFMTGREVRLQSPRDAISRGINLLPEERRAQGLVLDFSIEHNIVLSILRKLRRMVLLDGKKSADLTDNSIAHLQIKATGRGQKVRFLSGGNQQKVVIGKCLAGESSILLLDDPTFGVDIHSKREIMNIVKEHASHGNGVLFVSSEFGEIARFCTRTYIVKKGSIVGQFDNAALSEEQLLQAVQ